MGKNNTGRLTNEQSARIRLFFMKWNHFINLQELSRLTGIVGNTIRFYLIATPRKNSVAGYNNFSKENLAKIRKEFARFREDLDKIIVEMDEFLK